MEKITKIRICLVALGLSIWGISGYFWFFPETVYDANHAHPVVIHPYIIEGFILLLVGAFITSFGYRYKQRNKTVKELKN